MTPTDIGRFQRALLAWYGRNARPLPWRATREPYAVWVSEVMAQQTRIETVIPYFHRFMGRFPCVERLAEADAQSVLKLWEGLGYYSRARNLHRAAGEVVARWKGRIPDDWERIRALPGVGDYIAAAVLSIAFGRPHAVVDGNVKRVISRLQRIATPVNASAAHREFQARAQTLLHRADPGAFNQAVMELGALVCTPRNPDCGVCPVAPFCQARKENAVGLYPRREKKRPVPLHAMAIGVVEKAGRLLIAQRPTEGLLGGLWEFPGGRIETGETAEAACVRHFHETLRLEVEVTEKIARIRHAYTHFKVVADVFQCRYLSGRVQRNGHAAHRWIRPAELEKFPFPGTHHKFLELVR